MTEEKKWPDAVVISGIPQDQALLMSPLALREYAPVFDHSSVQILVGDKVITGADIRYRLNADAELGRVFPPAVLIENIHIEGTLRCESDGFRQLIEALGLYEAPMRLRRGHLRAAKYRARELMRETQRRRREHSAELVAEGWSPRAAKREARMYIPRMRRVES